MDEKLIVAEQILHQIRAEKKAAFEEMMACLDRIERRLISMEENLQASRSTLDKIRGSKPEGGE